MKRKYFYYALIFLAMISFVLSMTRNHAHEMVSRKNKNKVDPVLSAKIINYAKDYEASNDISNTSDKKYTSEDIAKIFEPFTMVKPEDYEKKQTAKIGTKRKNPKYEERTVQRQKQWYNGGTLHNATVAQWKRATMDNKLATCADFIAKLYLDKHLRIEINQNNLKTCSLELLACIDAWADNIVNTKQADEDVSNVAALSIIALGWNK